MRSPNCAARRRSSHVPFSPVRSNPLSEYATPDFTIGLDGRAQAGVPDGRESVAAHLLDRYFTAGRYRAALSLEDLSSGLYFLRIRSGHWSAALRIVAVE